MLITLEREVKLRFENPVDARAAIVGIGALHRHPRRLQSDALFDTDQRLLSSRGQVLRLRVESGTCRVTFKSPAEHPTMKLREELETTVGDGEMFAAILRQAGFRPWFRYEKYREEFTFNDVVIAVDETPLGTFVEIEGSERGIADATRALGREPADYILDSYRTLFVRHCEQHQLSETDMVFGRA